MRLDNSVVGERAGGAGGGASRPAPVTMGNEYTGVKEVQVIHVNIVKKTIHRSHGNTFLASYIYNFIKSIFLND